MTAAVLRAGGLVSTSKSAEAAALPTPLFVAAPCATETVTSLSSSLASGVTTSVQTLAAVVSLKAPLLPRVTDTSLAAKPLTALLKVSVTVKGSLVSVVGPLMVSVGRALLLVTARLASAAASLPMASVSLLVVGLA